MRNESAGGNQAQLPSELIPDFERFRAAVLAGSAGLPGRGLDSEQALDAWRDYGRMLYERSSSLALIAKGDRQELFTRHVLDSLNPFSLFRAPPGVILDIGSGGGLPGIPLGIAWPETKVVLLESREKKAGFLEQAVRSLGLRNVRVLCARLEEIGRSWREDKVDAVLVRAVGGLGEVLGHALGVTGPGAQWVYFLGSRSAEAALPETAGFHARVVTGAFGGRLLSGAFDRRG